jgi:hypothetical protein
MPSDPSLTGKFKKSELVATMPHPGNRKLGV